MRKRLCSSCFSGPLFFFLILRNVLQKFVWVILLALGLLQQLLVLLVSLEAIKTEEFRQVVLK